LNHEEFLLKEKLSLIAPNNGVAGWW